MPRNTTPAKTAVNEMLHVLLVGWGGGVLQKQKFIFSKFQKLESPRSRCPQGWRLLRPPRLACRQPSPCVLGVCPHPSGLSLCVLISSHEYGNRPEPNSL